MATQTPRLTGRNRRFRRVLLSLGAIVGLVAASLAAVPRASAATGKVDLRVLVIAAGAADQDPALEIMTRTLDSVGVPYDVLNSATTTLATSSLYVSSGYGKYNGVVLTISDLFQPGGGSGFTLAEWQLLHSYEREFGVRESVMSGWPTTDPNLDLDYGMDGASIGSVAGGAATWTAAVTGNKTVFEYVNTAQPLDMPGGFAFEATPRAGSTNPAVTPLLVDQANGKALVSQLTYTDGRQVLLSTISNTWFFTHSYVLAYEFLNFATKGLFIGSRQVYLSVHTDDLFIDDELWDPVTNTPTAGIYRMSPADVTATINAQNALRAAHPLASGFTTEFAYNGYGAGNGTRIIPNETYNPVGDAELRSQSCLLIICTDTSTRNYGGATTATLERNLLADRSHFLVKFDNQLALAGPDIATATLNLTASGSFLSGGRAARVCRVTQDWTEGTGTGSGAQSTAVSWRNRTGTTAWTTAGATFDTTNCVAFTLRYNGATSVNIMPILDQWQTGKPDYGVVVMFTGTSGSTVRVNTKENSTGKPSLVLGWPVTAADPLTTAIVANKANLRFINHTYATRQMDRICPEEPNPQPVLCDVTSYRTAYNEIARNRTVWTALGLPNYTENLQFLLTDSHAGIHDRRSTEEDPTDDVPYPAGKNNNLFQALQDLGGKYIASDSSRPGQNAEGYAPGFNVMISPRYPAAVWVNSSTPAQETDQYNWIFHDRFVAAGQDPCTNPAAICTTRTYQQILDAEAQITLLHMLTYKQWPHYMHQINLRAYDGTHSLEYDWANAVLSLYDKYMKLPVNTLPAYQLAQIEERGVKAKASGVKGTLDVTTGQVTIVATTAAPVAVTGLAGGTLYGGQYQLTVNATTTPTAYASNDGSTV